MRRTFLTCIVVMAVVSGVIVVWGADFYVIPVPHGAITWSQKLPAAERFIPVLDGAAVLDRETGLVWEQSPDSSGRDWVTASVYCYQREVGGRKGFRLPAITVLFTVIPERNTSFPFTKVLKKNGRVERALFLL